MTPPSGPELWLFHVINGFAGRNEVLDLIARGFVGDYFVPVVLSLSLLGLWFGARDPAARDRNQRAVMTAVVALIAANLIVVTFNALEVGARPRPFEIDPHAAAMAAELFYYPPDPTFPSNSMAVSFALAASAWQGSRRAGLAMAAVGAMMGLSRIYAGVHFPGDVLAGMAIGVAASGAGRLALRLIEPIPSLFLQWAKRVYLA